MLSHLVSEKRLSASRCLSRKPVTSTLSSDRPNLDGTSAASRARHERVATDRLCVRQSDACRYPRGCPGPGQDPRDHGRHDDGAHKRKPTQSDDILAFWDTDASDGDRVLDVVGRAKRPRRRRKADAIRGSARCALSNIDDRPDRYANASKRVQGGYQGGGRRRSDEIVVVWKDLLGATGSKSLVGTAIRAGDLSTEKDMAIVDCFTFFDELDVLEIRLEEMSSAVDCFVVVESTQDPTGKRKPLHFHENRLRYARFASKIRHVVVDDAASVPARSYERRQREALRTSVGDLPDDTTMLVSDVGEIIKPDAARRCAAARRLAFFALQASFYRMDLIATRPSIAAFGAPVRSIRSMADLSAPLAASTSSRFDQIVKADADVIRSAGWHFSWLGDLDRVIQRLELFAHTVEDPERWRFKPALAVEMNAPRFFATGSDLVNVLVDRSFPRALLDRRAELERAGLLRGDKMERRARGLARFRTVIWRASFLARRTGRSA